MGTGFARPRTSIQSATTERHGIRSSFQADLGLCLIPLQILLSMSDNIGTKRRTVDKQAAHVRNYRANPIVCHFRTFHL